jgi:hypothetical protein
VIVLQSASLMAVVDPAHGAEVVELIDTASGSRVLGVTPFPPAPAAAGEPAEDEWTAAYRCGWQVAAPNAGNACLVRGDRHGFHGAASVAAWEVVDAGPGSVSMRWDGHGLVATRTLTADGPGLISQMHWAAPSEPAPMVAVEHLVLGQRVLVPDTEIRLPGGRAWELSETDGPVRPPTAAPAWPELLLLDGSIERADAFPADQVRSRFAVVADVPVGRATVRSPGTGWGVELEWDERTLPHVWVWHEMRASAGLWRGQAELLGIEPASVPHSLGLERAVAERQAVWVEPGRELRTWTRLTVTPPAELDASATAR